MIPPIFIGPTAALKDRRLTLIETRVLFSLCSFRGKNTNLVWPSRSAIAERCGYDPAAISRAISGLKEKGWIRATQSRGPNTYELIGFPGSSVLSNRQENDVAESAKTVTGSTINSDRIDNETVTGSVTPEHTRNIPKNNKGQTRRKPTNGHPPPDGVDSDLWSDFLAQRKQLKAQNTDRAIQLLTNKLADNKTQTGESYTAQIERAIEHGWKSVYPLKPNGNAKPNPSQRPKRQVW